jgi:hypothetical protein
MLSHSASDVSGEPRKRTDVDRPYKCTMYPVHWKRDYMTRNDWRAHEAKVHGFHEYDWICMLDKKLFRDGFCTFCRETPLEDDNWNLKHDISACFNGNSVYTTRADIRDHVLNRHLIRAEEDIVKHYQVPDGWRREKDASKFDVDLASLWCGFCKRSLDSVVARMKHVGDHFKEKDTDMSKWKSSYPS